MITEWSHPDEYDPVEAASLVPDHLNVRTDGSLVLDRVTDVSSSGAGFFADHAASFWDIRSWGQVDLLHPVDNFPSCSGFCSVPGPLQSVQRAEMWSVILALQSSGAVHLGVDNLRHVGRLLGGHHGSVPLELVKDGDLLLLIQRMLHVRGLDTVRISKVKGHADHCVVLDGWVREVDRLGNDAADEAADFGRRRVGNAVIDARRNLSGVCGRWYPVLLDLHRFFIAFSRAVVNHVLQYGLLVPSPRGVGWFVRIGTGHFCPGHLVLGIRNGLMFLHLLSVLRTLLIGPILLVSWLNGSPF